MSSDELISKLAEGLTYQVHFNSKAYQVEVEMIENTDDYVHVVVAVDDGSVPASIFPLTRDFVRSKHH